MGVLLGFAFGSIPFGFLLVKLRSGQDVRQLGSGNIGATNVGRTLGRASFGLTLVADAAKGAAAVAVAGALGGRAPAVAAFAAVAGHCYTPWLAGRGGKGVATMLGSFVLLTPVGAAATALTLAAVTALTRTMSVGSLAGTLMLVVSCWWLRVPTATLVAALATALLVAWRHRGNITRLLRGSERGW